MPRTLVAVNAQGRVTLPADVRRRLRLGEGSQLEVAVEQGRITLRRARVIAEDDAWAYTPENLAGIRRALEDVKAGRVYRVPVQDLERIVETGELPPRIRRALDRKRKSA